MTGRAETFDHQADVGVAGEGSTLEEAFAAGARAMFSVMVDLEDVEPREEIALACESPEHELLFVKFLNALLSAADERGILVCDVAVTIRGDRLEARAWGEPFEPLRHVTAVEVKGATMTELKVERRPDGGWRAQTVVDV